MKHYKQSIVFNILFVLTFQAYLVSGSKRLFTCGSKTAQTACLPPHYNKFALPNADGVNPISIELLIEDILEIKETDQTLTLFGYFIVGWPD